MNLWIRTQDKTTLIRSYEIYMIEQQNMHMIRAKRTSHILGAYKTYERAIEILDEIQNLLTPIIRVEPIVEEDINPKYREKHFVCSDMNTIIEQLDTYVYEMPQD